jgi:hypothetical protein
MVGEKKNFPETSTMCTKKIIRLVLIAVCLTMFSKLFANIKQGSNIKYPSQAANHKNLKWSINYKPNQSKFIIYSCTKPCRQISCFQTRWCGGLGDRLKAISSAFLWSILTNRTLLIQATDPCPLQDSLDSNIIPWYQRLNETLGKVDRQELTSVRIEFDNSETTGIWENGVKIQTNIESFDFVNSNVDKDVIIFKANIDITGLLFRNPAFEEPIRKSGIKKHEIKLPHSFHNIYNMLFKLKPRLRLQFDQFLQRARPYPNTKLVCAQIRLGGDTPKFKDPIRMTQTHVETIWNFMKTNISTHLNSSNFNVFVTSDNEHIFAQARQVFGVDRVVDVQGEITHIDQDHRFYNQTNEMNGCERYDKTYLDFHVLGVCDMGVISRSGFGRLGVYNRYHSYEHIYTYREVKGVYTFTKTGY